MAKKYRAGEYYVFFVPKEYEPEPKDTVEVEEAKWVGLNELTHLNKNVDVSIFSQQMAKLTECEDEDPIPIKA